MQYRTYSGRNPVTHDRHRRDVFWQVTVPLVVGILLFLALAVGVVWSASGNGGAVSRWADISTMWLLIPVLFICLILLVILAGLIYLITWLLGTVPRYAFQLQAWFRLVSRKIHQGSDLAVEPVLRWRSFKAGMRALRRR